MGFLIGGSCPGTSIVGAATGKVDAFFYLGGVLTGIVIFGETTPLFDHFYNSSAMGRFTIPQWLGANGGVVVFVVTVVAIFLLWGSEHLERAVRRGVPGESSAPWARSAGAGLLALAAREVRNIYILEGGVNNWLAVYGEGRYPPADTVADETLRYSFTAALGGAAPTAMPSQHDDGLEYTPKVAIEKKGPTGGGGCG